MPRLGDPVGQNHSEACGPIHTTNTKLSNLHPTACQSLVAGDLNATLTALDSSMLDFDFISWGNAYYLQVRLGRGAKEGWTEGWAEGWNEPTSSAVTNNPLTAPLHSTQEDCPGYPSYDRNDGVACWQQKCGVDSPPEGCFDTQIACQHGDDECTGNLVETCVKVRPSEERSDDLILHSAITNSAFSARSSPQHLKPDFSDYMAFNFCYEGSFPPSASQLSDCAATIGLTTDDINACTSDADLIASLQQTEAHKTAQALIPGTPTLIMSGESISSTRMSPLLKQVCRVRLDEEGRKAGAKRKQYTALHYN